ncbi:MAG: ABC transporter ATP-binding protein [Magnetococcales bacterium]|nr:ABC transporter ATP-binding protein [Magnetococcales bacterium]
MSQHANGFPHFRPGGVAASPPEEVTASSRGEHPTSFGPHRLQGYRDRLRHLLPYYQRHLPRFFTGFLLLVGTTLSAAFIPILMKWATEALTRGATTATMGGFALSLAAAALVNAWIRATSRTAIYAIGRQLERDLRNDYHAKLLTLDARFFDQEKTGDLVSRGISDITAVRMFIGPGFLQLSNTFLTYLTTLPFMVATDPLLTLVIFLPFPLVSLVARILSRRLYSGSRAVADRFGALSAMVQETVSGISVIRNHAMEPAWQKRFDTESEELYRAHEQHALLHGLFGPLMLLGGGVGMLLLLLVGGQRVAQNHLTIGDFVAFTGFLTLLIWPTVGLGWIISVIQRGLAALDRIGQVLDLPSVISEKALRNAVETSPPPRSPSEETDWQGGIRISHLDFAYLSRKGEATPVLHDIETVIPPGSFIGLAGRIGSGKSTLLHLLAGLHPTPAGTLFIDDRPLESIPEAELRRHLALVPQESFLFSIPLQDNLLFGQPGLSENAAWEAATLTRLDEEIRGFPQGMQTLIGERGITLSGGQRQRAALARALAMQPRILLLDDTFSNVDAQTEEAILEKIHAFARGRTTLMVCHRTSSLRNTQSILLLDQGRIVASGPHETLLATSPLYQDLHAGMRRREALEALQ